MFYWSFYSDLNQQLLVIAQKEKNINRSIEILAWITSKSVNNHARQFLFLFQVLTQNQLKFKKKTTFKLLQNSCIFPSTLYHDYACAVFTHNNSLWSKLGTCSKKTGWNTCNFFKLWRYPSNLLAFDYYVSRSEQKC